MFAPTDAAFAALGLGVQNGDAFINGARIVATDVAAGDGVVHIIDGVLLP